MASLKNNCNPVKISPQLFVEQSESFWADRPNLVDVPTGAMLVGPPQGREITLSLVIPTYNERENLPRLIPQLVRILDRTLPKDYELIVVDDHSPDRTWEVALSLSSEFPQLRVMCRHQERGLAAAVIRGWQISHGRIVGAIDGDLQHPPTTILPLLRQIEQGATVAIASRYCPEGGMKNWSLPRRFLSLGAKWLGRLFFPKTVGTVSDPLSGYFLVRRQALLGKRLDPIGYKILLEILVRAKINSIEEVGYIFEERSSGSSKVTLKQYGEYIQHLFCLRFLSGSSLGSIAAKTKLENCG